MKQVFIGGMVVIGLIGGAFYLLWATGSQLFKDWRLNREVKEIKQQMAERKKHRKQGHSPGPMDPS